MRPPLGSGLPILGPPAPRSPTQPTRYPTHIPVPAVVSSEHGVNGFTRCVLFGVQLHLLMFVMAQMTPRVAVCDDGALQRSVKLNAVSGVGLSSDRICVVLRSGRATRAVCRLTEHVGQGGLSTANLDLGPRKELRENQFLLCMSPGLWLEMPLFPLSLGPGVSPWVAAACSPSRRLDAPQHSHCTLHGLLLSCWACRPGAWDPRALGLAA